MSKHLGQGSSVCIASTTNDRNISYEEAQNTDQLSIIASIEEAKMALGIIHPYCIALLLRRGLKELCFQPEGTTYEDCPIIKELDRTEGDHSAYMDYLNHA